jgi:hypothetical protein
MDSMSRSSRLVLAEVLFSVYSPHSPCGSRTLSLHAVHDAHGMEPCSHFSRHWCPPARFAQRV